jgi:long-chain acyl-CoA synthetase
VIAQAERRLRGLEPRLRRQRLYALLARRGFDGDVIRRALDLPEEPFGWQALAGRALHVGLGLRALGLPEGGHLGVLAENRIEWVLAQLGAGCVGAVTVGVYPTSPAPEVAYVLAHADAEIVVCEDQEQSDKVLASLAELPRLKHVVVMEKKGLADTKAAAPAGLVLGFDELEAAGSQAVERGEAAVVDALLARQTLADTALLIYTSGSTGKPKGAMISYGNVAAMAQGVVDRLGLTPATAHLSYLPLCHVAEQMLTVFVPLYLGSRVDFGESIRTVQEDLREVAPSMFLGVPRIWEKLHSAITIKMQETGPLRRRLYTLALRACEPFAEVHPSRRTLAQRRSEERRVGKECRRLCRSRWSPYH